MNKDIEDLINYAIKNGYINDDAEEWTDKEKQYYYNKCQFYEN